jgi:hypothetical protein
VPRDPEDPLDLPNAPHSRGRRSPDASRRAHLDHRSAGRGVDPDSRGPRLDGNPRRFLHQPRAPRPPDGRHPGHGRELRGPRHPSALRRLRRQRPVSVRTAPRRHGLSRPVVARQLGARRRAGRRRAGGRGRSPAVRRRPTGRLRPGPRLARVRPGTAAGAGRLPDHGDPVRSHAAARDRRIRQPVLLGALPITGRGEHRDRGARPSQGRLPHARSPDAHHGSGRLRGARRRYPRLVHLPQRQLRGGARPALAQLHHRDAAGDGAGHALREGRAAASSGLERRRAVALSGVRADPPGRYGRATLDGGRADPRRRDAARGASARTPDLAPDALARRPGARRHGPRGAARMGRGARRRRRLARPRLRRCPTSPRGSPPWAPRSAPSAPSWRATSRAATPFSTQASVEWAPTTASAWPTGA